MLLIFPYTEMHTMAPSFKFAMAFIPILPQGTSLPRLTAAPFAPIACPKITLKLHDPSRYLVVVEPREWQLRMGMCTSNQLHTIRALSARPFIFFAIPLIILWRGFISNTIRYARKPMDGKPATRTIVQDSWLGAKTWIANLSYTEFVGLTAN